MAALFHQPEYYIDFLPLVLSEVCNTLVFALSRVFKFLLYVGDVYCSSDLLLVLYFMSMICSGITSND